MTLARPPWTITWAPSPFIVPMAAVSNPVTLVRSERALRIS